MPLPRHKACTAAVEHHAASGFKVVSNGGRVTVEAIGDFFDPKILDAMEYGKTHPSALEYVQSPGNIATNDLRWHLAA